MTFKDVVIPFFLCLKIKNLKMTLLTCINCGKQTAVLLKNGTCSKSCSASLTNKNRLENNKHNFSNQKKIKCSLCEKEITEINMWQHLKFHKNEEERKTKQLERQKSGNCKYCNKLCKNANAITQHELRCKQNPNGRKYFVKRDYKKCWTEEKRKELSEKMKKCYKPQVYSEEEKRKMSINSKEYNRKYWTKENRRKHALRMLEVNNKNLEAGKNLRKFVKCKTYVFQDSFGTKVFLDGTWELTFAKWLNKMNIRWKRKDISFTYNFKDHEHLYYPDFLLCDLNMYVEVKGFEWEKDKYKWESVVSVHKEKLYIIRRKQIEEILKNEFTFKKLINECSFGNEMSSQ